MDEPTTGLDAQAQHELADLLVELRKAGKTIIAATHDLDCLTECFDQVLALNGRVLAVGTPAQVLTERSWWSCSPGTFPKWVRVGRLCCMNLELLLEPLQYGFMVRAFVGVGLVAVVAAAIGTFVVLKGLAFMGDAIAHTAFTGIAVGLLLGISIHVSALFFALVTSLGLWF